MKTEPRAHVASDEQQYVPPFVRRLMPKASEEEIQQAAQNLSDYLKVVYEIFLEREARGVCTTCGKLHEDDALIGLS